MGASGSCRVRVCVDETRNHGPPAKVDGSGVGSGQGPDPGIGAGSQKMAVADRNRLCPRQLRVHGDDIAVIQNELRTLIEIPEKRHGGRQSGET